MSDEFMPRDVDAERLILGTMLSSSEAAVLGLSLLTGTDFYEPKHQTIFETMSALCDERAPMGMTAVNSKMLANGTLSRVGGSPYLLELFRTQAPGQVPHFAAQVTELAMKRALVQAGVRLQQRASAQSGESAEEVAVWAHEELTRVRMGTGVADDKIDVWTEARLLEEPPAEQWLLSGLLKRGERLILTGGEGDGKTTLGRQIAVCAALGLDPFTQLRGATGERARVLAIDCENPEDLNHRRWHDLLKKAADYGGVGGYFSLLMEPRGIDLTQRGGVGWLMRRVERFQPDLIVLGPLYRLSNGDPNDERDARRVAAALDAARLLCNSALVLEAHSPHHSGITKNRVTRPLGSSLWLRWPEFGIGLKPTADKAALPHMRVRDLEPWRGGRDDRRWPRQIHAGAKGWPWIVDRNVGHW